MARTVLRRAWHVCDRGRVSWAALLLALLAPWPASAGLNAWTGGGPEGGTIYALAHDPSLAGRYFAGTINGVYVTLDGGATWNRAAEGANRRIDDLSVANDGTVYALEEGPSGGALFKSTNAGASWTALGFPGEYPLFLGVAPSNSARVAVVVRGTSVDELWISNDGGATFGILATGLPNSLRQVAFDPTDDLVGYCATGDGVFKSVDGGLSWAASSPEWSMSRVAISASAPLTVLASGGNRVQITTDGGSSWIENTSVSGFFDATIAPTDPLYMAIVASTALRVSTDGGVSWTDVSAPYAVWRRIQAVRFGATSLDDLLVGATHGVSRTTDGGATWTDSSSGIHAALEPTSIAASSATDAYLLNARMQSDDAGDSWAETTPPVDDEIFWGIRVDAGDPQHAILADAVNVFETTDGGATWDERNPDVLQLPDLLGIWMDPDDGQRWIVGNTAFPDFSPDPALAITADGGTTWEGSMPVSPPTIYLLAVGLEFHPIDPGVLLVAGLRSSPGVNIECWVRRSVDGGLSWTETLSAVEGCNLDLVLDPTDGQNAYLLTRSSGLGSVGVLRRSFDGGQSWGLAPPSLDGIRSIAADPATGDLYAGTDRLYRSRDGGTTWSPFPALPDPVRLVAAIQISHTTPPTFWASTNAGIFTYTGMPFLFDDGFESGDTSAWSTTVP